MTSEDLLLEAAYNEQSKKIASLIVRSKNDLETYKKKKDATDYAISIKEQHIEIIETFFFLSKKMFESQEEHIAYSKRVTIQNEEIKDQYNCLEKYAVSKGCDPSLVSQMRLSDFYNYYK